MQIEVTWKTAVGLGISRLVVQGAAAIGWHYQCVPRDIPCDSLVATIV